MVATHSPDLLNRLPLESVLAVTARGGSTRVGKVVDYQTSSVEKRLFTLGELHVMEGLEMAEEQE